MVTEYYAKGMNEGQIAKSLNIPRPTIYADMNILRRQALLKIQEFDQRIPHEYESMLTGIRQLLIKAWSILEKQDATEKEIAISMHTILTCYQQKRELLIDMSNLQEVLEYRHRDDESRHMMLEDTNKQHVQAIQSGRDHNLEAIF